MSDLLLVFFTLAPLPLLLFLITCLLTDWPLMLIGSLDLRATAFLRYKSEPILTSKCKLLSFLSHMVTGWCYTLVIRVKLLHNYFKYSHTDVLCGNLFLRSKTGHFCSLDTQFFSVKSFLTLIGILKLWFNINFK